MFSCGICKIFKNTYFEEQLRKTTSETCSFSWTAKLFWLNWSLCSSFCIIIYSFVHQFLFPIDTAVIRSSLLAIPWKVSVLTNFSKFTRKHLPLLMKLHIYTVLINFIKKEISARMFSCEFCEISHNIFFNELFGWLLLHKDSYYLLFHHYFLPFQNRYPTYCPVEYFPGLIRRLA